jgi:hypothetical protein
MGSPPASTEDELRLVDALSRLPARKVAELVWGDAGLRDRVLRRRRQRRPHADRADRRAGRGVLREPARGAAENGLSRSFSGPRVR